MQTLTCAVSPAGVARVEMARPQVFNAFDETMIGELAELFARLGSDPAVRVIVLSGQGKAFSAGADLQWMKRASEATEAWNLADARRFADMLWRIESCPKPTIARVHGVALGGGVGLACACDIALASDDARFAVSEVRFGILPSVIGPYLVNAVGKRHARRLALTARRIDAAEALQIGLVHAVSTAPGLDELVEQTVDELLGNGPQAQAEVKQLFAQLAVGPVDEATREHTARTISRVRMGSEAREGFAAFLDKRAPGWTAPRA